MSTSQLSTEHRDILGETGIELHAAYASDRVDPTEILRLHTVFIEKHGRLFSVPLYDANGRPEVIPNVTRRYITMKSPTDHNTIAGFVMTVLPENRLRCFMPLEKTPSAKSWSIRDPAFFIQDFVINDTMVLSPPRAKKFTYDPSRAQITLDDRNIGLSMDTVSNGKLVLWFSRDTLNLKQLDHNDPPLGYYSLLEQDTQRLDDVVLESDVADAFSKVGISHMFYQSSDSVAELARDVVLAASGRFARNPKPLSSLQSGGWHGVLSGIEAGWRYSLGISYDAIDIRSPIEGHTVLPLPDAQERGQRPRRRS